MSSSMPVDMSDSRHKKIKKIEVLEPPQIIRIGMTIPKILLERIDKAAELYGTSRSELVQLACITFTRDLLDTAWLEDILQRTEIKYGSKKNPVYNVEKLIDAIYDECPTNLANTNQAVLSPGHLEVIKNALQGLKSADSPSNKWLEFCNKCMIDPQNLSKGNAFRITYETTQEVDE